MTDAPTRGRDALLAAAVLCPLAAAAVAVDAPVAPAPVAAGALGTLALEYVLTRHRGRVRRLWARRAVRAGSVALALAAGAAAALSGPWLLTVLVAGLLTYLALLGAVAVGRRGRREAGDR